MAEIEIKTAETPAEAPAIGAQRPDHVPEKFWDAEKGTARWDDLAKSYNELSSKLGSDTKPDPNAKPEDETVDGDEEAQNKAAEAAGIDISSVENEFVENGALSEDTYAKFEGAGISKAIVDEVIQLRVEKAEAVRTELLAPLGGDAGYATAVQWAVENWSKEQIETYNAEVNSGDRNKMALALKALAADYGATKRSAKPNLLKPTATNTGTSGDRYQSLAQLMADQRDPKYGKDPAFTKMVEDKLARSNNF